VTFTLLAFMTVQKDYNEIVTCDDIVKLISSRWGKKKFIFCSVQLWFIETLPIGTLQTIHPRSLALLRKEWNFKKMFSCSLFFFFHHWQRLGSLATHARHVEIHHASKTSRINVYSTIFLSYVMRNWCRDWNYWEWLFEVFSWMLKVVGWKLKCQIKYFEELRSRSNKISVLCPIILLIYCQSSPTFPYHLLFLINHIIVQKANVSITNAIHTWAFPPLWNHPNKRKKKFLTFNFV